jgi:drug/metabolite transporter (DMT)-like permease
MRLVDSPPRAVGHALTSAFSFAVMGVFVRLASEVGVLERVVVRNLITLVITLVIVLRGSRPLLGQRRNRPFLLARSVLGIGGVICYFYAIDHLLLADAAMLAKLSPFFVAIFAAVFLGERLAFRRIAAVVAALVGALVILRPGIREVSPGHVAMLFTALGFAGSYLIAKRMSGEIPASLVVAILSVTVTIGLAPFALAVWVPPSLEDTLWLFLVALLATAGHYSMTRAFAAAPVTVTQPVTFLQLIWAALLGALIFAEPLDGFVILGGAIIMGSVSFITWRETMLRRALKKDERFVPAWNNLGVVLMEKGETGEARRVFETAFALDSGQSDDIRQNLLLAIEKTANPSYDPANDNDFKLVRRGSGQYLLIATP